MRLWTYIKSLNKRLIITAIALLGFISLLVYLENTPRIMEYKNDVVQEKKSYTDEDVKQIMERIAKLSAIDYDFICPEKYTDSKTYIDDTAKFTRNYLDIYPDATKDDILYFRSSLLVKYNCSGSSYGIARDNSAELNLSGKVVSFMTYGRIIVENHVSDSSSFVYFIAEPTDVITDSVFRYSPTTFRLDEGDTVKVIGKVIDECYWNDEDYGGCVPLVEIRDLQKVQSDDITRI